MADVSSVSSIITYLNSVIETGQAKAQTVPAPLILVGGQNKKSLSAREMAKEVILRSQEAGIPIGNLPDGSESIAEKMEFIRMEVLVKHLIENAKITIVIPAGTPVTAYGGNAGGPIVVQGTTINFTQGFGVLQ